MITLTIELPTPEMELQVIQEISEQFGYQATVPDPEGGEPIPNPQSRLDFAKRVVATYFGDIVKDRLTAKGAAHAKAQLDAAFSQVVIG